MILRLDKGMGINGSFYDREGDKFIVVVQVKAVGMSKGESLSINLVGDLIWVENIVVPNDELPLVVDKLLLGVPQDLASYSFVIVRY